MRRLILFLLFSVLVIAAFSQPGTRIKLRQLEAAPGSDYYIRSVNDTCAWVMNSEFADSLSVLQDSIIVLYANGSEVSRDTVGPFGSTGTVYYQLLRNDGSDQTERNATNFISTSTVVATLLDDSGSDETEVRMSVPTGGITSTEILDGTITTSDLAFTPVTDHGALTGLSDDDHTQYLLLAGRSGGQVATGGTGSGDDLTLRSTSNATKGDVLIQDQGGNTYIGSTSTAQTIYFNRSTSSGQINEWHGGSSRLGSFTSTSGVAGLLNIYSTSTTTERGIRVHQNSNNAAGASIGFRKSRGTSDSSPSAVTNGTIIGAFVFNGYSGSAYSRDNALFGGSITGSVSSGNVPTSIFFISGATDNEFHPDLLIHSNGRTGIGSVGNGDITTSVIAPDAMLHIYGEGSTSSTYAIHAENSSGTDLLVQQNDGALGILENLPARTLDVGGEVRIQDLVTDSPTKIVGSDSDGDLGNMYIGAGLTLSGDTLYADGSATTLYYQTIQDDGSDETQRDKLNFGDTGPFHFDVTDDAGNNRTDVLCYPDNNGITYGYIQQVSANKLLGNPTGSTANVSEIAVGDGLQFNGSSIQKINSEFHSYTSATTTTFNIPSGAQEVELICVGGGGGGGSGRKGATTEANTGGGGGGGGSYTRVIYSVSELASTTLDLTIGAGGNGGAGRATNNTNGGAGGTGGDTFVDCDGYTIALAGGGFGGSAGTTAASTGGAGGDVGDFDGIAGTGCPTSGSATSGLAQVKKSAQGGGAGGGIPTGGTPARTGGATGKWNYATEAALTGGSAGNDGQSCGISYTLDAQHQIGGPGGSGGGSSITGNAGSGGFPCYGGGGGGGGAALNSVGNSGAGGNGGAGFIIIIVRY